MDAYERAHVNAVAVQDACNFSGVLLSFVRDMEHVRERGHYLATHPVAILYIDKLADLQGRPDWSEFSIAYSKCLAISAEQAPTPAKQETT